MQQLLTIDQIAKIIESECESLSLDKEPRGLFEPIRYIMEDGGKRLRPMLSLISANIFSQDISLAVGPAIAVEIFHNFTLLHDDIMDNAPIRRGRTTVHIRWNENTAILSGDAMFPLAYSTLCRNINIDVLPSLLYEFNKVTMEVCQGQQYDMDFEHKNNVSINEYLEMIRLKTAVLMASAMKIGAIAVNSTPQQQQAMYEFGLNLGLAFQIQDDLLDTYGECITFGKNIGGDIAAGKQTFLMISAKESANEKQAKILTTSRNLGEVKAVYDALCVKQTANQTIEEYYHKSVESLHKLDIDPERLQTLRSYAQYLLHRSK